MGFITFSSHRNRETHDFFYETGLVYLLWSAYAAYSIYLFLSHWFGSGLAAKNEIYNKMKQEERDALQRDYEYRDDDR